MQTPINPNPTNKIKNLIRRQLFALALFQYQKPHRGSTLSAPPADETDAGREPAFTPASLSI